jgi:uncharacterized membrane protein
VFTPIKFQAIGQNSFAIGINNLGDIVGYTMNSTGTYGWLVKSGHVTTFQFPGSLPTMALGINGNDEIVGSFVDAAGDVVGFYTDAAGNVNGMLATP